MNSSKEIRDEWQSPTTQARTKSASLKGDGVIDGGKEERMWLMPIRKPKHEKEENSWQQPLSNSMIDCSLEGGIWDSDVETVGTSDEKENAIYENRKLPIRRHNEKSKRQFEGKNMMSRSNSVSGLHETANRDPQLTSRPDSFFDLRKASLHRVMNEGAYGTVVYATSHDGPFVAKVFSPANLDTTMHSKRPIIDLFHNEYTHLSMSQGVPNVVKLLGWGVAAGHSALVLEHCGDVSLRSWLESEDSVAFPHMQLLWRFRWALQLVAAVAGIHTRHVQHHDIKPDNIVVSQYSSDSYHLQPANITLIDFASATHCHVSGSLWLHAPSFSASTPLHVSPMSNYSSFGSLWAEGFQGSPFTQFGSTIQYAAPEMISPCSSSYSRRQQHESFNSSTSISTELNLGSAVSRRSSKSIHTQESSVSCVDERHAGFMGHYNSDMTQLDSGGINSDVMVRFGAADIWSLGLVLAEMFGGAAFAPFNGLEPSEIIRRHSIDEPPVGVLDSLCDALICNLVDFLSFRMQRSEIHSSSINVAYRLSHWIRNSFISLISCCLEKDPYRRPTAFELQKAIEVIEEGTRRFYLDFVLDNRDS